MGMNRAKGSKSAALSRRALVRSAVTAAAVTGMTSATPAQTAGGKPASNTRFIQPSGIYQTSTYTHVVEVTGPGRLIYTSGEQGRDKDGKLPADIRSQSIQALENIKAALAAAGATLDNVIKINAYMVDLRRDMPIFSEVRQKYFNKLAPPASTTIQVSMLTRDALLEVEVVASLPPVG